MRLAPENATQAIPPLSKVYVKIKWHVAPLLVLLYIIAFLDRVNISFASLSMNRDLHLSESTFGFGAGIFFVGYLLFAVPSNLMLVRFGAPSWIAILMICWGLLSASMAFVHGVSIYLLLRFLLGAAEAGFFPGIILYLTRWLPSAARASLLALFVIAIPLATVLGAPLSIAILSLGGFAGLKGWQWLFLIEGLPAVLFGLLVPLLLARGPAEVLWLSPSEKVSVLAALREDQAGIRPANVQPRGSFFNSRVVLRQSSLYFSLMIGLYALGFWVPRILSSRGVSIAKLGWLTAVPFGLGALGMLLCTWHSDRSRERKWHLFASYFVAAFGLALAAPAYPWAISLLGFILAAVGVFSAIPIFWAATTQALSAASTPTIVAFINSVGNFGGFVGPLLIGALLQRTASYTYGLLFTSASLLCGALMILLERRTPSGMDVTHLRSQGVAQS